MKTFASTLIAATLVTSSAYAAECGFGKPSYYIDWTSFAMQDADPSGRPTRAYAFPADDGRFRADPTIVHFGYSKARYFEFDSPKVVDVDGQKGGAMIISQNLLRPYDMTETQIYFEKPVSNLKIELHGVDDNARFGRAFRDRVTFIGRTNSGKITTSEVSFVDVPDYEAKPLLAYEADRGLAGDNLYPVDMDYLNGGGFASYEITFQEKVKDVALRFSSVEGNGSVYAASSNPSPQQIELGRVTFCMGG
jgi:hypothetical protein